MFGFYFVLRTQALWVSLACVVDLVLSQSTVQTFFPAAIPLTVRSPYLSVWQSSTNGSAPLSRSWPQFWNQLVVQGPSNMGWAGKIRVDGQTYSWLGNDPIPENTACNVTNVQITPTRSIFVMQAGPMNVTITFLSPIEPTNWVSQSLPFTYVSITAQALDSQTHRIQVYSDISAEWLSGDREKSLVEWSQHSTGTSLYHEIRLQSPLPFKENNEQAQDGMAYYAMKQMSGLTWQIDRDQTARDQFGTQGTLTNSDSRAFATIEPIFTVYAIALDLGQIQDITQPVTWAIGYVRDPSIQYTGPDGSQQQLHPYYVTKYSDISTVIDAVISEADDVLQRATALDQAIMGNASHISSKYADLIALSARQTMGSLDITVQDAASERPGPSQVRTFMKDIGFSGRVNPAERIFAAMPAFIYLNASYLGTLLSPLLDAQQATTAQVYAATDIGTQYPIAVANNGPHSQRIEQSGNMLILLYAHARFSGDGALLQRHYNLTKQWADYLVNNSLIPNTQLSADNGGAANLTNLAIKGIIGVKAMAEISRAVGNSFDAQNYDNQATTLFNAWQTLALSSDKQHILGTYGSQQSWALMYNLYADRLLGTNLVNQALLMSQTAFYKTLLSSVPVFGLAIDSEADQMASAAWTLFTAAIVQDNDVRDILINSVWARATSNVTAGVFPSEYDPNTGSIVSNSQAGPAVGAMFSILALNVPNTTIVVPPASDNGGSNVPPDGHKAPVGAIAGGVTGGVIAIALAALGVYLFRRRQRRISQDKQFIINAEPHRPQVTPFASASAQGTPYDPNAPGGGVVETSAMLEPPPHLDGQAGRSSKMRERFLNTRSTYQREPTTPASSTTRVDPEQRSAPVSNAGSSTAAASNGRRDPLSPTPGRSRGGGTRSGRTGTGTGSSSGSLSTTDVLGLRAEVENLRRVMQEIHAERMAPPPEYTR